MSLRSIVENRKLKHARQLNLITDKNAPFGYVEAYKALRTNIEYAALNNHYKSIMVTSSAPVEGKTSVTTNLALALASGNKRVILVDCDMRKGMIASYLGEHHNVPGIMNVLVGEKSLKDVIVRKQDLGIDVLFCGTLPANPAEVVGSEPMKRIMHALEEVYDYVIVDTPPTTVVTDAVIMSQYLDAVLLVARSDVTDSRDFEYAKQSLTDVNAKIIGCVLNDLDVRKLKYGRRYKYYHSRYGSYGAKKPQEHTSSV